VHSIIDREKQERGEGVREFRSFYCKRLENYLRLADIFWQFHT